MAGKSDTLVAEFYCGIGGLHHALKQSSISGTIVRAFDWDQNACNVYTANHGPNIVQKCDISSLTTSDLALLGASLWLLSPACQPYTVLNPNAKGALDPRAASFLHLVQIVIPELVSQGRQPTHLLVENVAGFELSTTREIMLEMLRRCGYETRELLLTPLQFGIPNSRLRYYLVARSNLLRPSTLPSQAQRPAALLRHIPRRGVDWLDPRQTSSVTVSSPSTSVLPISAFLDSPTAEHQLFSVPDRVLEKWGRLFDVVKPSSDRTCCFTRGYTQMVERSGSVLQLAEDLETEAIFNKFLAAQASQLPGAVRILDVLQLRYFSPTELLRLFCFLPLQSQSHLNSASSIVKWPDNPDTTKGSGTFIWPASITQKTKYRLIGNSVNIRVVRELIEFLFEDDWTDELEQSDVK